MRERFYLIFWNIEMNIHDAWNQWSLTGLIDNLNDAADGDDVDDDDDDDDDHGHDHGHDSGEDVNQNENVYDSGNQHNDDDDDDSPTAIASWKHT